MAPGPHRCGSVVVVVGLHGAVQSSNPLTHSAASVRAVWAQVCRHASRSAAVLHAATHALARATTLRAHVASCRPQVSRNAPSHEPGGEGGEHTPMQPLRSVRHAIFAEWKVVVHPRRHDRTDVGSPIRHPSLHASMVTRFAWTQVLVSALQPALQSWARAATGTMLALAPTMIAIAMSRGVIGYLLLPGAVGSSTRPRECILDGDGSVLESP